MTRLIAGTVFMLGMAGLAFGGAHEGADVGADIGKAEECIQCHEKMGMSLRGSEVDELAGKIKAISTGQNANHDPVLQGASDADIAEVARLLSEKG